MNGMALCAGVGGLELGLHLLTDDYRTVGYVEREAYPAATLVARMADASLDQAPIWDDVATFDGRPWRGVVDCITAGYPCQPFSTAGKRGGENDERHLWPHIRRIVGEVSPELVILENVPGHVTLGFDVVRSELQRMGYRVAAGLFSAAEVGAPHERLRLFVVAHRSAGGFTELRESSEEWGRLAHGSCEDLVDAQHVGRSRNLWRSESGIESPERCEGMVDAPSGRRELSSTNGSHAPSSEGTERCGDPESGSRCGFVDDSEGRARQLDEGRQDTNEAGHVDRSGCLMANPGSDGIERRGVAGDLACTPGATEREGLQRQRCGDAAGDCRADVPDSECERGFVSSTGHDAIIEDTRDYLPLFPPRPNDREGWARVLEQVPAVEPAVCRVANELAFRVDRLRGTGNGVHAVSAAVAIFSLWLELVRG
jgi:DNA (cytosine-5)-methyltransferase 1